MLQAALAARRLVLGSAHPDTLATVESLKSMRSEMRATQPTMKGAKAAALQGARGRSTALSDGAGAGGARAGAAEAELLALLELEEAGVDAESKGKANGKAKGKASKR